MKTKEAQRIAETALAEVRKPIHLERDNRVGPPNIDGMCTVELPIMFGHGSDQQMTLILDGSKLLGNTASVKMSGASGIIGTKRIEGRFEMELGGFGKLTIKLVPDSKL